MTKKAPSEWNLHVKSVFAKGKADKGKGYSFKQALTDAAKTWHGSSAKGKKAHKKQKGGEEGVEVEIEKMGGGESSTSDEGDLSMGDSSSSMEESSMEESSMEGGKKSKKSKKRTMKGGKKSRKGKKGGKKSCKNKM